MGHDIYPTRPNATAAAFFIEHARENVPVWAPEVPKFVKALAELPPGEFAKATAALNPYQLRGYLYHMYPKEFAALDSGALLDGSRLGGNELNGEVTSGELAKIGKPPKQILAEWREVMAPRDFALLPRVAGVLFNRLDETQDILEAKRAFMAVNGPPKPNAPLAAAFESAPAKREAESAPAPRHEQWMRPRRHGRRSVR